MDFLPDLFASLIAAGEFRADFELQEENLLQAYPDDARLRRDVHARALHALLFMQKRHHPVPRPNDPLPASRCPFLADLQKDALPETLVARMQDTLRSITLPANLAVFARNFELLEPVFQEAFLRARFETATPFVMDWFLASRARMEQVILGHLTSRPVRRPAMQARL